MSKSLSILLMSFNKELYIIADYLYKEIKISSFFMPTLTEVFQIILTKVHWVNLERKLICLRKQIIFQIFLYNENNVFFVTY